MSKKEDYEKFAKLSLREPKQRFCTPGDQHLVFEEEPIWEAVEWSPTEDNSEDS